MALPLPLPLSLSAGSCKHLKHLFFSCGLLTVVCREDRSL
jgi:hypothetical protein